MEIEKLPHRPRWSWWDAMMVLVALFALIPVTWALRKIIKNAVTALGVTGSSLQTLLLFSATVIQATVMVLAVIVLTRRKGSTGKDLGLIWQNPRNKILTGLLGGLVLGIGVIGVGALVSAITGPPPPQDIERFFSGIKTGRDLWLPFISVSVLAPFSEELYFRGMIYPLFRVRLGPAGAMVLSALFFGALHLDLYRLIPISAGGIVLAYFYERTGSLLTSMVAHSTWNTLMLLMLFLAGGVTR